MSLKRKHSVRRLSPAVSETPMKPYENRGSADNATEAESTSRRLQQVPEFQPFPVNVLPDVLRDYVVSVARSIGCDTSFVVLPVLTVCAGVIGNARRLRVKRGWFVPPIIWTAVIGESGTQKSPPLRAVFRPLKARQQNQIERHISDMAAFRRELADYKRQLKAFQKTNEGTCPREPECPVCERCLVSDTTIEGLVPILQANSRGIVLQRDELVGWIGGFDKYSKGGTASTDVAHWLSIYNADPLVVDRKTGEPRTLYVPHPAVSVCGTIQPGVLDRVLNSEHRENGLSARLLMTYPPRKPKRWTDDEIPEEQEQAFAEVVERLAGLQPDVDSEGAQKPGLVFLAADALSEYIVFYNTTAKEQAGMTGDLAASWSKLEESAARLALVFHCVREVVSGTDNEWTCDAESMSAGIAAAEWFKVETERIQTLLSESEEEREIRSLAGWIKARGGIVRPRDLVSNRRDTTSSEQSELKLQTLVAAGLGEWRDVSSGPRGGRPSREFILNPQDSLE